jgi:hypothetical protein
MQVVVNNTDITNYIIEGSYQMDSNDIYESWKDGNMREHRIIVAHKVSGKFQVVCSNRNNSITLHDFLTLWNGAVDNGVVTLGVYILDTDSTEMIEAYYDIENVKHDRAGDGSFIDVLEIKITER